MLAAIVRLVMRVVVVVQGRLAILTGMVLAAME
jgi:hypothetical protein